MAPNPPFVANEIPSAAKWNTGAYRYDVSTSEVDVVNTTTETTIYTKTITGGHTSTDRTLHLTIDGDQLNNSGGNDGVIVRVKLGGSTILTTGTLQTFTGGSRRGFLIVATVQMLGSASSEWLRVQGWVEGNNGDIALGTPYSGAASANMVSDQTLEVTAQWATASTTRSFRKKCALLVLI